MNININSLKSLLNEDNQLELSIFLSIFFDSKDLYNISEDVLKSNLAKKRDISNKTIVLYRYSKYNKEFVIRDMLYINNYPPIRFIQISSRVKQTAIYRVFRYHYTPMIYEKINKIVAEAYNLSVYGKSILDKGEINKGLIYENYAKRLDELMSEEDKRYIHTPQYRFSVNYFIRYNIFSKKMRYIKIFDLTPNIQAEVTTITDYILKFTVYKKDSTDRDIIYLDRGTKGKGHILLVLDTLTKMNKSRTP